MIRRRTAVGLSLLCALLFSAIAVQSASAAKAVNTTAFTCVEGKSTEDFEDEHCDKKVAGGEGEYGHVAIAEDTTTKFEGVQLSNAVLKSKAAGAAVEVVCTVVKATGELHNVKTEGKHTVTGGVTTEFSSCTIAKPKKCVVEEPIVTKTEFEGVEELGAGKNEMGVEHSPEGENPTFVELDIKDKNKGVEECPIEGKFPVTGTAVQTGAVAPTDKHTGATGKFTDTETTPTMKFQEKIPQKAGLELSTTVKMHKDDAEPANPIALTTIT